MSQSESLYGSYEVDVDLIGSRLGPEFHSVTTRLEWDGEADELRRLAAEHYGVSIAQVGTPRLYERDR